MKGRNPLISIIILNYNGGKVTENCLCSVFKSTYPNFEIILLDNGSSEEEILRFKKKYGRKIKLVLAKKNLGYASGNNLGALVAKGEFLVFLNNDTLVSPDWLRGPLEKLRSDPKIAFLQPKIKWLEEKNFFEYAGGAGGFIDFLGYSFVRGRIFGSVEEDVGQYNDEREIFWASGVALFCRKKIFEELGRFDNFFFAYHEEIDLCFRAQRKKYKVVYFPTSEILHLGGFTGNKNLFKRTFLKERNNLAMMIKNLSFLEIVCVFPFRFVLDISSTFYYLRRYHSLVSASAVVTAYLSTLINLPKIFRSRYSYRIKEFGYPRGSDLVTKTSIIWQYFILGRKTWNEIYYGKKLLSKIIKIF